MINLRQEPIREGYISYAVDMARSARRNALAEDHPAFGAFAEAWSVLSNAECRIVRETLAADGITAVAGYLSFRIAPGSIPLPPLR
jgi:hypothetical protein